MITANMKKKKTLVYILFVGVVAYLFAQVVYFNQAYSPLQVLADARSEAKRLLHFITLYHFQCNTTVQISNVSYWPICVERNGGINLDPRTQKIAYSIGPSSDMEFEQFVAKNLSFHVYTFGTNYKPATDSHQRFNKSKSFKMSIVPNNPADFVRNSYDTQTINNVMYSLGHTQVDIMKMDNFMDSSHPHEILYYMVKDELLPKFSQLHIALHIDKVDDDYLYNWYRALYNLFHDARFRLYHTSASDPLCIQVTLMESCVYYMSWIRDPGPRNFVLHPLAKDGSQENEITRLVNYISEEEADCPEAMNININTGPPLVICQQETSLHKPCNIIIVRNKPSHMSVSGLSQLQCHAVVLHISSNKQNDGVTSIVETFVDVRGSLLEPSMQFSSLMEALDSHLHSRSSNILYLDIPSMFWDILTPLLDSGHLQSVDQLVVDIDLWNQPRSRVPYVIRRRYSELNRIAAYGFQIYESKVSSDTTLRFKSQLKDQTECCYRIGYVRTKHISIT